MFRNSAPNKIYSSLRKDIVYFLLDKPYEDSLNIKQVNQSPQGHYQIYHIKPSRTNFIENVT